MPKCKVKEEWLRKADGSGHVVSEWGSKLDDTRIRCNICCSAVSCEASGFQAITQHAKSAKHKDNAAAKLSSSQLRLGRSTSTGETAAAVQPGSSQSVAVHAGSSSGSAILLVSKKDESVRSELLWCMKCVACNFSGRSCEGIGNLFKAMCPQFPAEFSLGRTKFGYYITEALGPHFRKLFLDDITNSWYTCCYDETTNSEGWKELQVSVRFWSAYFKEVAFHHLESFFIGRATAEVLKDNILLAIRNADLPLNKLIMLSMDGPNVNKKTFRLVSETVQEDRGTALIDIGTCNLHIVHNSYEKGLERFGERISDLAIAVHSFFDVWGSRWEDYVQVQERLGVPNHRFLKHVFSRWLSLSKAAERLLEQWLSLKEYFLKVIPKAGTQSAKALMDLKSYQNICAVLRDSSAEAEVLFVVESANIFEQFSLLFQKEEPMIHLLYEEMHSLVATIMGRVCKPETILNIENVSEPFTPDNLLPLSQVEVRCSEKTRNALRSLKDKDKAVFLKNVQDHFTAAAKHLLAKSVLRKPESKYFKFLKPESRASKDGGRWLVKVASLLKIPDISASRLRDEWILLQLEDIPTVRTEGNKALRIDHYWQQIFELKNASGDAKYPSIRNVVTASLVLAHGSADVERQFSTSGNVLTEDTPRMSVRTLNAKLNVKAGMRQFHGKPELVSITSDLMTSARFARSKYQEHLDKEKRQAEEQLEKERQEEDQRRAAEDQLRRQEETSKEIKKLENDLKSKKSSVKDQRKAADKLLEEAEGRLKNAVKRKDFEAVQLAQGMLEGAKKMRKEVQEEEEKAEKLQTKIDKKKSGLITSFNRQNK